MAIKKSKGNQRIRREPPAGCMNQLERTIQAYLYEQKTTSQGRWLPPKIQLQFEIKKISKRNQGAKVALINHYELQSFLR